MEILEHQLGVEQLGNGIADVEVRAVAHVHFVAPTALAPDLIVGGKTSDLDQTSARQRAAMRHSCQIFDRH